MVGFSSRDWVAGLWKRRADWDQESGGVGVLALECGGQAALLTLRAPEGLFAITFFLLVFLSPPFFYVVNSV